MRGEVLAAVVAVFTGWMSFALVVWRSHTNKWPFDNVKEGHSD